MKPANIITNKQPKHTNDINTGTRDAPILMLILPNPLTPSHSPRTVRGEEEGVGREENEGRSTETS